MEDIQSSIKFEVQYFNFESNENENDFTKHNCILSFFDDEKGGKFMTFKGSLD